MSEINVTVGVDVAAVGPVTVEQVAAVLAVVEQVVGYADLAAKFTGTKVDDSVVDFQKKAVAAVKPYAQEAWVVDLVNVAVKFFGKPSVRAALDALKAAVLHK